MAVEHFPAPAWRLDPDRPQEVWAPGVRLVFRGEWPGDRTLTGELPGPGEAMLRDYDAQGGWALHFFSDHTPVGAVPWPAPDAQRPRPRSVTDPERLRRYQGEDPEGRERPENGSSGRYAEPWRSRPASPGYHHPTMSRADKRARRIAEHLEWLLQ